MADPVLRASWLSPTSVRLEIEYSGGSNFEVWSKDSTPQGSDYTRLASIGSATYDVTGLNWSTTYYFKVRAMSGETYTAFSNEISLFCACGHAYVSGAPPPGIPPGPGVPSIDYWQQSADPDGDDIAFVCKNTDYSSLYLFERTTYRDALDPSTPVVGWIFRGKVSYEGTFFPAAVRKVGTKVAIFDLDLYYGWAGWLQFNLWDGASLTTARILPTGDSLFPSAEISERSLPYSMEFNASGRVVIAVAYMDWDDYDADYPSHLKIRISNDLGFTWGDEITIASSWSSGTYSHACSMAEAADGTIWIVHVTFDQDYQPAWNNPATVKAIYRIYKLNGTTPVSVRTITTNLYNTWGPGPSYTQTGWAILTKACNLYAEGSTIVACYVRDFTMSAPYYGTAKVYLDISTDNGSTWQTREVTIPGEDIYWDAEWLALLPAVCLSNGNILVYLVAGTGAVAGYRVLKSTDGGLTWAVKYSFPGITLEYPWVFQLRSDGSHVTLTGCKAELTVGGGLGLWESTDGGETWVGETVDPITPTTVLGA